MSSDKLLCRQSELAQSLELAKTLVVHQGLKEENVQQFKVVQVWERRLEFAELKHKFPALGIKKDEELLHKKQQVIKKLRVESTKYDRIFHVPLMLINLPFTVTLLA